MQGYKVYGAHLGPFKTPARESDPGVPGAEFNAAQLAWLSQFQRGNAGTGMLSGRAWWGARYRVMP
jgi:hypothetical protein